MLRAEHHGGHDTGWLEDVEAKAQGLQEGAHLVEVREARRGLGSHGALLAG